MINLSSYNLFGNKDRRKMSDEPIRIKMDLNGDLKKLFEDIKERYMLKTNAETVRICISEAHRSIFGEK